MTRRQRSQQFQWAEAVILTATRRMSMFCGFHGFEESRLRVNRSHHSCGPTVDALFLARALLTFYILPLFLTMDDNKRTTSLPSADKDPKVSRFVAPSSNNRDKAIITAAVPKFEWGNIAKALGFRMRRRTATIRCFRAWVGLPLVGLPLVVQPWFRMIPLWRKPFVIVLKRGVWTLRKYS